MDKKAYWIRVALVVFMLLFVSFSYYAYQIFFTANFQVAKEKTYLYIPTGATFQTVLDSLEKNQIVHDKLSFAFISKLLEYQENVKAGKYLIPANANNLEMVKKLRKGHQEPVKFTFNNIRLLNDFAAKADEKLEFSSKELMAKLKNNDYLKKYKFDTSTIMCMFIPNTYEFYWNISADEFMERMDEEYKKFWNKKRTEKAAAINFSPVQVSILASIVEAETNKNDEKPRIAGLYINRYNINMPLQADPTVKYALGDFSIKRVYAAHTEVDSPYNTYKNRGLPPGPINMPSSVSIDAVLNYEQHKFIYFCASPNEPGYHEFSENYRDHVNKANRYRKYLNKKNIR